MPTFPQLSGLEYLLLSIIGAFILAAFKSLFYGSYHGPKETHATLANKLAAVEAATSAKLSSIEAAHYALALKYEGSHSRHDEALDTLESNVNRLTEAVNRLCIQMAKSSI